MARDVVAGAKEVRAPKAQVMQEARAETSRANRRGRQRVLRQTRIRGFPRAVERQAPTCALERIKERELILLLCLSLTYRAALLVWPGPPPLGPGVLSLSQLGWRGNPGRDRLAWSRPASG